MLDTHAVARSLTDVDFPPAQADAITNAVRLAAERGRGLSLAVRIGAELVAALAVGVGIGLLLDSWLGTAPWMLVAFFVLGAAAGMLNVYRVMERMNRPAGDATGKRTGGE